MIRILLIAALLVCVLLGCENNPNDITAYTRDVQEVEVGNNIKAVFSQSANLKAELSAPVMYRVKADTPYTEFPQSMHVDFFDEQAKLQSVLNAKYGKYFDLLNKVFLRDNVVAYNTTTGDTLFCQTLWWDQTQNSIYTDDSVRIRGPHQQINGTGLWAKSDFSKYTIKNVTGPVELTGSAGF